MKKSSVVSFLKGFVYAGKGFIYTVRTQRNMRVHICFTVFMFFFLLRYDFWHTSTVRYVLLGLTCAAVMALECINTAVESIVDLVSPQYNRLAGAAKDTAAAAVLVFSVGALAEGIIFLWQPQAFKDLFSFYGTHILECVIVCVCIVIALSFVFLFEHIFPERKSVDEN